MVMSKNNGDGTFTYTPADNYNGADSFTYTVTDGNGQTSTATVNFKVNSVNDGPTAIGDSITVVEDNSITTGNLLANDTDTDGDALVVKSVSEADHGTVIYKWRRYIQLQTRRQLWRYR